MFRRHHLSSEAASEAANVAYREWLNSPAGIAEMAARENKLAADINRVNELVDNAGQTVAQGIKPAIKFLAEYGTLSSHDIRIEPRAPEVIKALEGAGYSANDAFYDAKTTIPTPEVVGRWLLGSAIHDLKKHGRLHPLTTIKSARFPKTVRNYYIKAFAKRLVGKSMSPESLKI